MQRQDPKLAEIITYLSTGDLPMSDKAARKILMIEDQFTLDDGVLSHFFAPKSRHAKRSIIRLRKLCVPSILKLDILNPFMSRVRVISAQRHCLRQLDTNISGLICTRIHCCIVSNVDVALWL